MSSRIQKAKAYTNGEVAYIAWKIDNMIHGCLGFEITRKYPNGESPDIVLAAWVPFKGQSNPDWNAQNTSVWPIQKLSWRDLTLVRKRDSIEVHPQNIKVQYLIRPVIAYDGNPANKVNTNLPVNYTGTPIALSYVDGGMLTNVIDVGTQYGNIRSTFTNGIMATQWLSHTLKSTGATLDTFKSNIQTPGNDTRQYMTGQVLNTLKMLLEKAAITDGASLKMAIYELTDPELIDEIIKVKDKVEIILSNTAVNSKTGEWDTENHDARQKLKDAGIKKYDRFFNNVRIGHNKFVLYLESGKPKSVMMGSTNWTYTGLCAQSNNATIIDSEEIATYYDNYWNLLKADTALFTVPNPTSEATKNVQGSALRSANLKVTPTITLNDEAKSKVTVWFSPNTMGATVSKTQLPPDLSFVYSLMRKAEKAIFFAVFLPGMSGPTPGNDIMTNVVTEAIALGEKDSSLMVYGSLSSPMAMPNYIKPVKKTAGDEDDSDDITGKKPQPTTYDTANVHLVRAFNLQSNDLVGNFEVELLTAGIAIIHDKIIVIDPFSENPVAIFGSHNLGFKASYANDENLVIVQNNPALVQAYAVHVLDIYEHYRFRAVQEELHNEGKPEWDGFLSVGDGWLSDAMSTTGKGDIADYICG
jgi:hypothetical protein